MWHSALLSALVSLCLITASIPATSQAIVLNPEDILPELAANTPGTTAFYINGAQTYGLNKTDDQRRYSDASATKLVLSLLTLRMADKAALDLDASVSLYLPGLIPTNPFDAPITVRHLLQETAGFASPPMSLESKPINAAISQDKLKPFAISIRSAGQASSHDPVGWAVLAAVLEQVGGAPISQLIDGHITQPLGLSSASLDVRHQSLSGEFMPLVLELSIASFAEIVRPLIRNRDKAGQLFLKRDTYASLIKASRGFKLHPNGSTKALGISISQISGYKIIKGLSVTCSSALAFIAFPVQGAAFIAGHGDAPACTQGLLQTSSLKLARDYFPPRNNATVMDTQLARPSKLEGRYILASRSPAGLSERLAILKGEWLSIYGYTGANLLASLSGGVPENYLETGAYDYQNTEQDGFIRRLHFSPYKLGGYLSATDVNGNETLYRRVDSLGRVGSLFDLMPWALLLSASAGLYALRPRAKPWRNMGLFGLAGAALVGAGLYFEMNSWASVLYVQDQPWVVILWRTSLNIGLMLLLALPMFVLSFARNKNTYSGPIRLIIAPHLALITAAALMVFLALVMSGVAGTFGPY